jgi:hypothetical protein
MKYFKFPFTRQLPCQEPILEIIEFQDNNIPTNRVIQFNLYLNITFSYIKRPHTLSQEDFERHYFQIEMSENQFECLFNLYKDLP